MTAGRVALVLFFVVGMIAGMFLQKTMFTPETQNQVNVKEQSFQPEIKQEDGTRTLERITSNRPTKIKPSFIPGKVTRIQEIQVRAETVEPVKLEIVQSESEDGIRVTVKAERGEILSGRDIVIPRMVMVERNLHWNTQIFRKMNVRSGEKVWGILQGYERGRFVASLAVFPANQDVLVGVGWRY